MAIHAEALSVATTEFHDMLSALGIAQHRAARLFGVGPRGRAPEPLDTRPPIHLNHLKT
jgi:hypothetical protein